MGAVAAAQDIQKSIKERLKGDFKMGKFDRFDVLCFRCFPDSVSRGSFPFTSFPLDQEMA